MASTRTPFLHIFLVPAAPAAQEGPAPALPTVGKKRSFLILKRFIRHLSFVNLLSTHLLAAAPPFHSAAAGCRSAKPYFQKAASADGSPPTAANSSEHVSPAVL